MVILYDKKTQKYYFPVGEKCSTCDKMFLNKEHGLVKILFKYKQTMIFCEKCVTKSRKYNSDMDSMFVGIAIRKLPDKAMIVNEKFLPPLRNSDIDVWDMSKSDSPIMDHTKYSGRVEYTQMGIPQRPPLDQIDMERKSPLKDNEIDDLFTNRTPVKPGFNLLDHILPEKKPVEIEDKSKHLNTLKQIERKVDDEG
jgi:hypothetical protein